MSPRHPESTPLSTTGIAGNHNVTMPLTLYVVWDTGNPWVFYTYPYSYPRDTRTLTVGPGLGIRWIGLRWKWLSPEQMASSDDDAVVQ